jgi:hypothetical protein
VEDMDVNVQALLHRAVDRKGLSRDFILLLDTISILETVKRELLKGKGWDEMDVENVTVRRTIDNDSSGDSWILVWRDMHLPC